MKYILIFVYMAYGSSAPTSTVVAEFDSLPFCFAAAAEVKQQAKQTQSSVPLILCAAKGPAQTVASVMKGSK